MVTTSELMYEYVMYLSPNLTEVKVYDYGCIREILHILYNYGPDDGKFCNHHGEVEVPFTEYTEWLGNRHHSFERIEK